MERIEPASAICTRQADIAAARKTAQEEALGAALVRFGMIVTATVSDPAGLPLARQTVESLSATARLHLRPAYGNQDVAFLAGLPLGVILPKMTMPVNCETCSKRGPRETRTSRRRRRRRRRLRPIAGSRCLGAAWHCG